MINDKKNMTLKEKIIQWREIGENLRLEAQEHAEKLIREKPGNHFFKGNRRFTGIVDGKIWGVFDGEYTCPCSVKDLSLWHLVEFIELLEKV